MRQTCCYRGSVNLTPLDSRRPCTAGEPGKLREILWDRNIAAFTAGWPRQARKRRSTSLEGTAKNASGRQRRNRFLRLPFRQYTLSLGHRLLDQEARSTSFLQHNHYSISRLRRGRRCPPRTQSD